MVVEFPTHPVISVRASIVYVGPGVSAIHMMGTILDTVYAP
jgi:hypothetical protein